MYSSRSSTHRTWRSSSAFFLRVRRTYSVGKRNLWRAEPLRLPHPEGALSPPETLVVDPSALRVDHSSHLHTVQHKSSQRCHDTTRPIIMGDRPQPPSLIAAPRTSGCVPDCVPGY